MRLLKFLGRALAVGAIGLVIIAGGSELVVSIRARAAAATPAEAAELAVARASADSAEAARAAEPEPPAAPSVPYRLRVPEGRTELGDGVYVLRTGSGVVVHFDIPMLRTRRSDKFERMVRETLPRIHGGLADSLLADVRPGFLAGQGDLLYDLPARGIHLPSVGPPVLSIFPETRLGRDGPLVVAYRITPGR